MSNVSDGVHGPVGASENWPRAELEVSSTEIGACAAWAAPVALSSVTAIAPDGAFAAIVCGGVVNVRSGCVQVRNDFHCSVKAAPGWSPAQVLVHASIPGSAGLERAAESRIAAAIRSMI